MHAAASMDEVDEVGGRLQKNASDILNGGNLQVIKAST